MSFTATDIEVQPQTAPAFRALVAEGGHLVEEWFTEHDSDENVVLFGDCSSCMTELCLLRRGDTEKPSKEAARRCPGAGGDDEDWS